MNKNEDHKRSSSSNMKLRITDLMKSGIQGFKSVLKKRDSNDRFHLIVAMLSFLGVMVTQYSYSQVFMYVRLKLNFAMEDFSVWYGFAGVFIMAGNYIFVPFVTKSCSFVPSRFPKFQDATIALIGTKLPSLSNYVINLKQYFQFLNILVGV